jgi:hypothetical protein
LPQITIEYMIMIPLLIMQVFILPFTAGLIMNGWADSRRTLALEETASYMGSSIEQLYLSFNHNSIATGNFTSKLDVPPTIEGFTYTGKATLRTVLDPALNSSKILDISLTFVGTRGEAMTSVILGQNVEWQSSVFMSNSTFPNVKVEKYPENAENVIRFSFGGE